MYSPVLSTLYKLLYELTHNEIIIMCSMRFTRKVQMGASSLHPSVSLILAGMLSVFHHTMPLPATSLTPVGSVCLVAVRFMKPKKNRFLVEREALESRVLNQIYMLCASAV